MAGGTFTTQNKVRPGVYINFVSEGQAASRIGDRGVTTMALPLSWGPSKQIVGIEAGADIRDVFGYDINDPKLLLVREALKRARTLLLYRLNEGTKATATHEGLTIAARYGGERGNDIQIIVQANIDESGLFDVYTLVGGEEVDVQTVADIDGLNDNAWVTFAGTGDLEPTAGVTLTGGNDGTVTNADHTDYLAAAELQDFHTIALTSDDSQLKGLYAAFAKRLRDEEGKKIQVVIENYPGADYEGVISVKNGVVLSGGTELTAAEACAWVAGATAGAGINESLTYQAYDDAVDVVPRYTNSQIESALRNGEFVFTSSNGRAIVEQDINSLISFTSEKDKQFSKNRVVRVLDGINNDFKRIFESYYIGKVDNNADGHNLLRSECNSYLDSLQNINAIQNFDSQTDIAISPGADTDSVYIEVEVQPVDSVEKIYMKVMVR